MKERLSMIFRPFLTIALSLWACLLLFNILLGSQISLTFLILFCGAMSIIASFILCLLIALLATF